MESAIFVKILLFLFVQSIVQAHNIICFTCEGQNSETCEHKEVECPDGHDCMTVYEQYVARGKVFHSILKRCARNLPCNVEVHGHAGNDLSIRSFIKCCNGDRCNSGMYEMPKNFTKEKGIVCPICRTYDTLDGCKAERYTVCWGEKDVCAKFTGTIQEPDGVQFNVSAQGCSSPLGCIYDYTQEAGVKVISYIENECYTPNDPPSLEGTKSQY